MIKYLKNNKDYFKFFNRNRYKYSFNISVLSNSIKVEYKPLSN